MSHSRRVVVTGLGWVTSFGHEIEPVWADLLAGRCGVKTITRFDTTRYSTKIGGEITRWDHPHISGRDAWTSPGKTPGAAAPSSARASAASRSSSPDTRSC